ncbi:N-acetylglucosamine kinase [Agromyces silvae]|uniref:N-acetylglucosamine kinase n=1 Tax=Agromyces silvae TaxID=3388266 RepID=UPI00280A69F5|nr:BadF/BadG/BcrA/BcrD ATPase family protein [Agromyces protaetiae]
MSMLHVGVDLGQGGCRARARAIDGETSEATTAGYWSSRLPAVVIADAVHAAVNGRSADALRVGVGMTGLNGGKGDAGAVLARIASLARSVTVVVADDSFTGYLGALGPVTGAVIAAGTGAVALGVDLPNRVARSDGWGAALGDRGSGHWIGLQAIRGALAQWDGGRPGPLLDAVTDRWGDLDGLAARWRAEPPPPDDVAAIVPAVAEAARAGDRLALDIWRGAGTALGSSVADVLERLHLAADAVPVAGTGGVFGQTDLLGEGFRAALTQRCPAAQIVRAHADPLAGALILAEAPTMPDAIETHLSRETNEMSTER